MPRPLRQLVPGGIHHVTVRGNRRQLVFYDDHDRRRYLGELRRAVREHDMSVLAYALMPNHVHLVVQDHERLLSRFMQLLNARYTRYMNKRHHLTGHLYQGRFHARWVDRDSYLLEVTRYVHLNPVRAHLADRAETYPWSSYRVYVGMEPEHPDAAGANPQLVWSMLEPDTTRQPTVYRTFVDAMTPQKWPAWERNLQRQKLIDIVPL